MSYIKMCKILGISNAGLKLSYVTNFLLNSLTGVFDVGDSYYYFLDNVLTKNEKPIR